MAGFLSPAAFLMTRGERQSITEHTHAFVYSVYMTDRLFPWKQSAVGVFAYIF